jgi:hypothetical protein
MAWFVITAGIVLTSIGVVLLATGVGLATKVNWATVTPLVISLFALGLSMVTYYANSLKPFKLSVRDTVRYQVTKNPMTEPLEPALILDLIFFNGGAVYGVVEDVAVVLNTPSGEKVLLRSFLEVSDRTLHDERNIEPLKTVPFASFGLSGRESALKSLFFMRKAPATFTSFTAGKYTSTLYARPSSTGRWHEFKGPSFALSADDVEFVNSIKSIALASGQRAVAWRSRGNPTEEANAQLKLLEDKLSR